MPGRTAAALFVVLALVIASSCRARAADAAVASARVGISFTSDTTCEVSIDVALESRTPVEHRLRTSEGTRAQLRAVRGAQEAGGVREVGRTLAIVLTPDDSTYGFDYRVEMPAALRHRCPVWLPAAPTTGQPGGVRLDAEIPSGSAPLDSLPTFVWTGTHGTASLAHLPAVVRVEYGPAGASHRWTLARLMDAVAVTVFAAASAVWIWRLRR